jgi:antitoxin (DNA-binding transcriptional repressor) of toxin-antitoxin stability system
MENQIITVEVQEAGAHMDTLIDAVMVGGEVVLTHCGEPVASVHLHHAAPEAPESRLRATVVDVLDETLRHLRDRLDPPMWLLN